MPDKLITTRKPVTSLYDVAQEYNVSMTKLYALNPQFKRGTTDGKVNIKAEKSKIRAHARGRDGDYIAKGEQIRVPANSQPRPVGAQNGVPAAAQLTSEQRLKALGAAKDASSAAQAKPADVVSRKSFVETTTKAAGISKQNANALYNEAAGKDKSLDVRELTDAHVKAVYDNKFQKEVAQTKQRYDWNAAHGLTNPDGTLKAGAKTKNAAETSVGDEMKRIDEGLKNNIALDKLVDNKQQAEAYLVGKAQEKFKQDHGGWVSDASSWLINKTGLGENTDKLAQDVAAFQSKAFTPQAASTAVVDKAASAEAEALKTRVGTASRQMSNTELGVKIGVGVLAAPVALEVAAVAGVGAVATGTAMALEAGVGVATNWSDAKTGGRAYTAGDAAVDATLSVGAGMLLKGASAGIKAVRGVAKNAAEESAQHAGAELAKETAGHAGTEAAKETAGHAGAEAAKETAGHAGTEVAKETAGHAGTEVAKDVTGHAAEAGSKASTESAAETGAHFVDNTGLLNKNAASPVATPNGQPAGKAWQERIQDAVSQRRDNSTFGQFQKAMAGSIKQDAVVLQGAGNKVLGLGDVIHAIGKPAHKVINAPLDFLAKGTDLLLDNTLGKTGLAKTTEAVKWIPRLVLDPSKAMGQAGSTLAKGCEMAHKAVWSFGDKSITAIARSTKVAVNKLDASAMQNSAYAAAKDGVQSAAAKLSSGSSGFIKPVAEKLSITFKNTVATAQNGMTKPVIGETFVYGKQLVTGAADAAAWTLRTTMGATKDLGYVGGTLARYGIAVAGYDIAKNGAPVVTYDSEFARKMSNTKKTSHNIMISSPTRPTSVFLAWDSSIIARLPWLGGETSGKALPRADLLKRVIPGFSEQEVRTRAISTGNLNFMEAAAGLIVGGENLGYSSIFGISPAKMTADPFAVNQYNSPNGAFDKYSGRWLSTATLLPMYYNSRFNLGFLGFSAPRHVTVQTGATLSTDYAIVKDGMAVVKGVPLTLGGKFFNEAKETLSLNPGYNMKQPKQMVDWLPELYQPHSRETFKHE